MLTCDITWHFVMAFRDRVEPWTFSLMQQQGICWKAPSQVVVQGKNWISWNVEIAFQSGRNEECHAQPFPAVPCFGILLLLLGGGTHGEQITASAIRADSHWHLHEAMHIPSEVMNPPHPVKHTYITYPTYGAYIHTK